MIVSCLGHKGGVGKSTLAQLIAVGFAIHGWKVKIADLDTHQQTSVRWNGRRLSREILPQVAAESYGKTLPSLSQIRQHHDLVVVDGVGYSCPRTLKTALVSQLVLLPTGESLADLEPTARLATQLLAQGAVLRIVLQRVGTSKVELASTKKYLQAFPFKTLENVLPERTSFRVAGDQGLSCLEVRPKSLQQKASALLDEIADNMKEG